MQSNSTGAVAVDFSSTPARNQTRITSITIPGKNPYHLSQSDKLCDSYNRFKKALCFAVKKKIGRLIFFTTTILYIAGHILLIQSLPSTPLLSRENFLKAFEYSLGCIGLAGFGALIRRFVPRNHARPSQSRSSPSYCHGNYSGTRQRN